MPAAKPPFRLYYFFQRGCVPCAGAVEALRAFRSAHPTDGCVLEVDAWRKPEVLGFQPKRTPAYFLRVGVEEDETIELKSIGALTLKELERMLKDARKKWTDRFGEEEEDDV